MASLPDNPFEAYRLEKELRKKPQPCHTVADCDQIEHIAKLLRNGVTRGIGILDWEVRTAPGQTLTPQNLHDIANDVEEGYRGPINPDFKPAWRLEIKQ